MLSLSIGPGLSHKQLVHAWIMDGPNALLLHGPNKCSLISSGEMVSRLQFPPLSIPNVIYGLISRQDSSFGEYKWLKMMLDWERNLLTTAKVAENVMNSRFCPLFNTVFI